MTATSLVPGAVGVADGAGVDGFSLEHPAASSVATVQTQNKLKAFMGAKFSRPAGKSHARNLAFQAIGGGAFLSSCDFWFSFIALVIKLPCDVAWERRHMEITKPTTKTKITTPMAQTPLWPIPELSGGGAAAFVGVSGSLVISV